MTDKVIIVISSHASDWGKLKSKLEEANGLVLYVSSEDLAISKDPPRTYNLVMIDGQNGKKGDFTEVVKSAKSRPVLIIWHKHEKGLTYTEIENSLRELKLEFPIKLFSHQGGAIWEAFEPVVQAILEGDKERYEKLFPNLCHVISDTGDMVYNKAYEILSIFLPVHIELQLENNQEQCRQAAAKLLNQNPELAAIRQLIEDNRTSFRNPDDIERIFEQAEARFKSLIGIVEKIQQCASCEDFERFRQDCFASFHRDYIDLRDRLLEIVEAFEMVGA